MTHQNERFQQRLSVSRHARQRMAQRSISQDTVDLLLKYGDAAPCGGRSTAITIRRYDLQGLREDGICGAAIEKLNRLCAVMSDDGTLVTVMHRYRRAKTPKRLQG